MPTEHWADGLRGSHPERTMDRRIAKGAAATDGHDPRLVFVLLRFGSSFETTEGEEGSAGANSTCCSCRALSQGDATHSPPARRFCSAQITGPLPGFPTKEFPTYLQNLGPEVRLLCKGVTKLPSRHGTHRDTAAKKGKLIFSR